MVRECQPDDIGMSVSYPLPGTKFYDNVKLQLGDKKNWLDSGDFDMMYQGEYSTEFYRQLHTVLHKEYRARKTWRELTNGVAKTRTVRRKLHDAASMSYNWATLPIERRRLDQIAKSSWRSLGPLPQIMTPEAAAKPTRQPE